jgi:hypothetical protein
MPNFIGPRYSKGLISSGDSPDSSSAELVVPHAADHDAACAAADVPRNYDDPDVAAA